MISTLSLVETRARELDVLSQAVIATDLAGDVVYWNAAAERLYGWTSAEALGRSITELTPAPYARDHAKRIMDTLRAGEHWVGEFAVSRKDGGTFIAHVVDTPVHDDDGTLVGIVGISSDVTPATRLQRLARDLSAAATPREVAEAALSATLEVSGGAAGWFMSADTEHDCLETLYSVGYPPDVVARFHTVPLQSPLPIAIAAREGLPVIVTSADEWRSRFPSAADLADPRTKAWIALPLSIADRIVGAMGLSVRIARAFTADERDVLLAMSQNAAIALERAQLFHREQAARRSADEARKRAEEANRAKSAFLATMSHELRTPVGAIIGYHDLLAEEIFGPLTSEQRAHLQRLRNSATHLLSLIEELLTHSRLEASREVVHPDSVQLGALMQSVSDIVAPLARAKQLEFTMQCAQPDVELRTDSKKLKQILVNLAGNAVKYTERGGVNISCVVVHDRLRVTVTDTGIGIAKQHHDAVFEPFWQVPERRARQSGGTGLGLSVSRALATLLGGTIHVQSELGKGSAFILEVPIAATES